MRFLWLLVPVLAGTVLFRFAGGAKAQNPTGKIDATYQNGVSALKRGDLASARTAFEKIIKLAPQIPEAHNSLGWVLLTQGETDNAIVQFRTALRFKPAFVQAHINLANALSQKKNLEEAAAEARTAVTIAPKDSEAHRTLGRVLSLRDDPAGAISEFGRAIEIEPQRPDLHDELGSLLAQQGQMDAAAGEFSEALKLQQPNFTSAWCAGSKSNWTKPSSCCKVRCNSLPKIRRHTSTWAACCKTRISGRMQFGSCGLPCSSNQLFPTRKPNLA
jgi:Tfp pilus assembly protein PilF